MCTLESRYALQWRHNEGVGVLITSLTINYPTVYSRCRSKKAPELRVTGVCVTGELPAQRVSNAENVSICWRHHVDCIVLYISIPVRFTPPLVHRTAMKIRVYFYSWFAWWRHALETLFRIIGLFWTELTVGRWITSRRDSNAELWYFPCYKPDKNS